MFLYESYLPSLLMSEPFDPYRIWLESQRTSSLSHYQLLGVVELNLTPMCLNAADRQMAHVRTFQSKHSEGLVGEF